MDDKTSTELVPVTSATLELPPILVGRHTAVVEAQVRSFYGSVADIFERWVTRRSSKHTQRAYRQDVRDFVAFLGLNWPDESTRLFTVSVADVLAFSDRMLIDSKAPQDHQPADRLAFELLQVPPGRGVRVPAPDHGPEPRPRPVHLPWVIRPSRRDQGPLRYAGSSTHGAAVGRYGL